MARQKRSEKQERIQKQIAARIKRARLAAEMTPVDIAHAIGVGYSTTVTNWESGITLPETVNLPDLAKVLGVSLDWLLAGKGSMEE